MRLSDGPNGVRGTRFFHGAPAACLPCGTALGATFDVDLIEQVGHLLGEEAKAKGAHCLLGPTINIQRAPLGGRGFESYSEDPYLAGMLAGAYCKGVQAEGIIATPKHMTCNDQEHERMAVNSIVTERALREVYLLPFQLAIKHGDPGAIMTAYNKINGTHSSENSHLLSDILRNEWKFRGLAMSDWFGTYSVSEAITAGLALEMPGPTRWRGGTLTHAVKSRKLLETQLDGRVREVLNMVKEAAKSGIPENAPEKGLNRPQDQALLRKVVAESIVLLKNENSVLPFDPKKPIAVIGPNASIATYCGGGSAALEAYYTIPPLDGVKAQAESDVFFAQGCHSHKDLPLIGTQLTTPGGKEGFRFRVYNEPPGAEERVCVDDIELSNSFGFFVDYKNAKLTSNKFYADITGIFAPDETGLYDFGVSVEGTAKVFIDDALVVDNATNQTPGSFLFGLGTIEERGSIRLEKGKQYNYTCQWGSAATSTMKVPGGLVAFGNGGFRLGGCRRLDVDEAINHAVEVAKKCDQVIVFAGLNSELESEGFDRDHMDLPPRSDELIERVVAANPKAAICIQSGTPVTMPWADQAAAILQAWYGGNELGNGLADIIFGKENPSAKLPLSFPVRVEDNPAYLNYRSERGRVLYGEDVYVGYKYYDALKREVLYPFGHGLSYTTFELSNLSVSKEDTMIDVSVDVKNTGSFTGKETVQVYVSQRNPSIKRPLKDLKGFKKVLLNPGESKKVEIKMERKYATSFWDEDRDAWTEEMDSFEVLVGTSSRGEFLKGTFDIEKTSWWNGL